MDQQQRSQLRGENFDGGNDRSDQTETFGCRHD